MGREYTQDEIAAAIRVGVARKEKAYDPWPQVEIVTTGPMIYATGSYYPGNARKQAAMARKLASDWDTVADAMDREWKKPLP